MPAMRWAFVAAALLLVVLAPLPASAQFASGLSGRVFFLSTRGSGLGIWVADLDRGSVEPVLDLAGQFSTAGHLVVSPDATQLAFRGALGSSYRWERNEVWIVNTDGTNLRQATDWPYRSSENVSRWSPTEPNVLYYIHDLHWDGYVRRIDLASGTDTPVPRTVPGGLWTFDLAKDGGLYVIEEEACCVGTEAARSIIYQTLDGSSWNYFWGPLDRLVWGVLRVNQGDGWLAFQQAISPGGRDFGIWKLDPSGGGAQLIMPAGVETLDWAGHTNDGFIVYSQLRGPHMDILAVRAREGAWPDDVVNITNSPGDDDWSPTWTPIPWTPPDTTPPAIAPTVDGVSGFNGWYTSDVSVSWSVTDPDSEITSRSGCDSRAVTEDTTGVAFTCTATSAGGQTTRSVSVKRDTTAPTVACSVTPAVLWPANHKMWDVTATATASDANAWTLKGIDIRSSEADSGLGADDVPNDIQGFPPGLSSSGQLRAERYSKAGRTYTLNFTVADDAGNTGACATTVSVPHDQGKGSGKNK